MHTREKSLVISLFAFLVVLLIGLPAAAGEADDAADDILVNTLRANRKAMVAVNLRLADSEAEAFWSVYSRYEAERSQVGDRLIAVIEDYSAHFPSPSDEKATQLVQDYLEIERDRVDLRMRYLEPFSAALSAPQVLRFYQIENKIDAVLRYDLAAQIPVLEQ